MDADNSTSPSNEQEVVEVDTPAPTSDAPVTEPSAGALLKAYREAAGFELETLAAALKVSPQKLQSLESDDYDALPALYFARGLAANVCRYLRQDATAVLAKMPDEKPVMPVSKGTDATMRDQFVSAAPMAPTGNGMPKWIFAVAALLILAAAVIFAMPRLRERFAAPADEPASAVPDVVLPEPVQPSASAAIPMTLQPASMPVETGSAAAATPSPDTLQIHATGSSWVRVSNTQGRILFEGNLQAGQQQQLSVAEYPIRLTIGKAENVQVIDRGQPFDLSSVATQGTARFEIKP